MKPQGGRRFCRTHLLGVGGLVLDMSFPFLPEEVLPFNVKIGRELPSTKPAIHLSDGVVQKVSLFGPYSVLKIGFRK